MSKKIVSFSLYGSNPLYIEGALRNADLVPKVYQGWVARFYVSDEINQSVVQRLENAGAEVRQARRRGSFDGTFWRFLAAGDKDVQAVVFRDTDSRPSRREFRAVEEWLASGKSIHIMRDHPEHRVIIMAGMWGCLGGAIPDMEALIDRWGLWERKGVDQVFLREVIYPRFRNDLIVHSDLYSYAGEFCRPFPIERAKGEFVGAVIDHDRDTPTDEQIESHARKFQGIGMQQLPTPSTRPWIKTWMRFKQRCRSFGLFRSLVLFLMLFGSEKFVQAQAKEVESSPVEYELDFQDAHLHVVRVRLNLPAEGLDSVRLMMPVWTPGSYMVREYARQVEKIEAWDAKGSPRAVKKIDKNHWTVESKGADRVLVEYQLYGREMGVRTNWIEEAFAFITGAATFITPENMLERPHLVRCKPREGWGQIATSLTPINSQDPWVRRAENFDELIDSPLVLGTIDIRSRSIGGVEHYLATAPFDPATPQASGLATNRSEAWWDTEKAMADVVKLVEVEQKFWGDVPYTRYWFLNLITESGGGLEHDNSTVLMTSRWAPRQRAKYVDWLGLVSHEFFHTWNVRRLRPKVLKKYDYNQEQYFHELWIAEGLTSYYDDLFVIRAGLCTPKEYLERLSKTIQGYQNSPGRLVQNVLDSSFDSWIKFYRPDENATNSRISYYIKGALIGMLLDAKIRSQSEGKKSLDDCMRLLWERHHQSGYENADFLRIVSEVAGEEVSRWLERELESTQELDYSPLLETFGLKWKPKETTDAAASQPNTVTIAQVGLELSTNAGKTMVEKVLRSGVASRSGVQVGDEILGLGEFRASQEQWSDLVGTLRQGDRVKLLVARRGKILERELDFRDQESQDKDAQETGGAGGQSAGETPSWNLIRVESPTDKQEGLWKDWLQIPAGEAGGSAKQSP
jgi:predicted metalloprotease with PDZ domain